MKIGCHLLNSTISAARHALIQRSTKVKKNYELYYVQEPPPLFFKVLSGLCPIVAVLLRYPGDLFWKSQHFESLVFSLLSSLYAL